MSIAGCGLLGVRRNSHNRDVNAGCGGCHYGNLVDSGVDITLDEMLGYFIGYGGSYHGMDGVVAGAFVFTAVLQTSKARGNNE